jgi:glyoxylase-like metal-dependent hydrolase (beta-lactamase superfamily II)
VSPTREIAPGVHHLEVGKGLLRSNVYFIQSGPAWVLIDAGPPGQDGAIRAAAESVFGKESAATAILLTHDHPDHAGSARELAGEWGCPVWVHPEELPLVIGGVPAFYTYANPLDRWVILPWLRALGSRRTESMVARASLKDVARPLDRGGSIPGLPDWVAVHTPGHTPGHVALFRPEDRVLITGDALVTMAVNSVWGLLTGRREVSGPPRVATWSWRVAQRSMTAIAELRPRVVAGGHGVPMSDPDVPDLVQALAGRVCGPAMPRL